MIQPLIKTTLWTARISANANKKRREATGNQKLSQRRDHDFSSPIERREVEVTTHAIDYLVHFSNILLLVSDSVREMLWLRCLPWPRCPGLQARFSR